MALMNDGLDNDLLKAAEQDIESKIPPSIRVYYQRIVLAGIKYATHGGADGVFRDIRTQPDPVKVCGIGGANVAFMLLKSENPHPTPQMLQATVHASYTLTLQAMDVASKMKPPVLQITEGDGGTIDQATRAATDRILLLTHVTPDKLNTMATKVHGLMQNPQQAQAIRLKLGVDRDPRAPMPTLPDTPQTEETPNGTA